MKALTVLMLAISVLFLALLIILATTVSAVLSKVVKEENCQSCSNREVCQKLIDENKLDLCDERIFNHHEPNDYDNL